MGTNNGTIQDKRKSKTYQKIEKAIIDLRRQKEYKDGKEISYHRIQKQAQVSRSTIKKTVEASDELQQALHNQKG